MDNKVGIELTKKLVVESLDVIDVSLEKLKDGFQLSDVFSIFMEAKDLDFLFSQYKELAEEIKDLDDTEIETLVDLTISELEIENEHLKDFVVKLIKFIHSGYELFVSYKVLKS